MQHKSPVSPGTLYVVATPIGNLEDITFRAIRILKEADFIAAEDTRHTKKLLNHYSIKTKQISYYREKETQKAEHILQLLKNGHNVALVSDAGTPGISDPGAVIINMARNDQIPTVPIPGPSALATALSCSGITDSSALFLGFAPAKKNQRRQLLKSLIHSEYHIVFYESPHRISSLVKDAYEILGERQVFMARELTKTYEELEKTFLSDLLEKISKNKNRGEFVLIVFPGEKDSPGTANLDELILWYRDHSGQSLKDSCKNIASDLGLSRSKIYQKALKIWQNGHDQ